MLSGPSRGDGLADADEGLGEGVGGGPGLLVVSGGGGGVGGELLEHVEDVVGRGSAEGVLVPAALNDVPEALGLAGLLAGEGEWALLAGDGLDDLHVGLEVGEGDLAGVDLVEDHGQGVDVGGGGGLVAVVDLGGQPAVGADKVLDGLDGLGLVLDAGGAKVADLGGAAVQRHQDVEGLEVAVHQVDAVQEAEARGDAHGELEAQGPGQLRGGVLEQVVERALHQLQHHQRGGVVVGAEELHDVGVPQRGHRGHLLDELLLLHHGRLQVFDRHLLPVVLARVHRPEAARGDGLGAHLQVRHVDLDARRELQPGRSSSSGRRGAPLEGAWEDGLDELLQVRLLLGVARDRRGVDNGEVLRKVEGGPLGQHELELQLVGDGHDMGGEGPPDAGEEKDVGVLLEVV